MWNEAVGTTEGSESSFAFSLFSAGKSYCVLGRSPGFEANCLPFPLPRHKTEWCFKTAFFDVQWRDRAGFSPDFPIKPRGAPEDTSEITHETQQVKHETQEREHEIRKTATPTRIDAGPNVGTVPRRSHGSFNQLSVTKTPLGLRRRSSIPHAVASRSLVV